MPSMRSQILIHPVATVRGLVYYYTSRLYDRLHGIDAGKQGYQKPLERTEHHPYDPTEPKYLRWAFRQLSKVDLSDFTFVDFGSGKGRVLVHAAGYRFKIVMGVEYSKELHQAALANVSRAKLKCPVSLVNIDARDFRIPDGDCVLFLYNPFSGAVMEKVLGNIRDSLTSKPRTIFLVYVNPLMQDCFAKQSGMTLLRSRHWCNLYLWQKAQLPV